MRICVFGLWHLGCVTAACLASGGHEVVGLDDDAGVVDGLRAGNPPLFEPGLAELIRNCPRLSYTTDPQRALAGTEVVWVTVDTPVDADDNADVENVIDRVQSLFPHLNPGTLVLISSQLPVGSTRRLEASCADKSISFAYSPENLRLGKAIEVFTKPDRVVVGTRNATDRSRIEEIFRPWEPRIEWMSVESAEMTKHALNGFLATSVAFINEIAAICEQVGAEAKEVERGLKSESRIGPQAYLSPGSAFAGGTLARDVSFLTRLGEKHEIPTHLLSGVNAANNAHKDWTKRKLEELLDRLQGRCVAIWGLTYKPGTDTLRRSASVELCLWLSRQGARVRAHDPAVKSLPREFPGRVSLCATAEEALAGADALVVATGWPDYRAVAPATLAASMKTPMVLDASRFLASTLEAYPGIRYFTVGKPAL